MQNTALEPVKRQMVYEYDFTKQGGAIGDIDLSGQGKLPVGAIVTSGIIRVTKAVESAGSATVAFKVLSTDDILAATAKTALTLNALIDIVPDGTSTNMFVLTSAYAGLTMTVATAALTAGKIVVALDYTMTE